MSGPGRKIKVLFVGQCLQFGYEDVRLRETYPTLAHAALSARYPEVKFIFESKMVFHPKGLRAMLRYRLPIFRPDIVVITALATYAATQWRTGILYELAPELAVTARSFVDKLDAKLRRGPTFGNLLTRTVDGTFALRPHVVHPPLGLDEYEQLLEDAVHQCRRGSRRIVLMGPGGFNEYNKNNLELQSPKLWSAVNEMVLGLARRMNLSAINSQDALHEHDCDVFLREDHKFSRKGQAIVAREVEAILATEVATLLHEEFVSRSEVRKSSAYPTVAKL
jgi:hypothetical protein